jgi:hypothetical protein
MKLYCGLVLMALLLPGRVSAQVESPASGRTQFSHSVFGIGLFGGAATGLGLSFRHHLPSSFSYQVVGGVINASEKLSYDFGMQLQFDLIRSATTRFYAGSGIAFFYAGKSGGTNEMDGPGRLGLGIGGEFNAGSDLNASLELMFTYFTDGTILPLPQLGVHYYFE